VKINLDFAMDHLDRGRGFILKLLSLVVDSSGSVPPALGVAGGFQIVQ
jgi:hypothetical protein